jgi:hypothetical protein
MKGARGMTINELIEKLTSIVDAGVIDGDLPIKIHDVDGDSELEPFGFDIYFEGELQIKAFDPEER